MRNSSDAQTRTPRRSSSRGPASRTATRRLEPAALAHRRPEARTLTEAERRLGSTQPSVGRHLRGLELALGESLFAPQPCGLKPTYRGRAPYGLVSPMKASMREAERLFAGGRDALVGTVRIAAAEVYATHVVAPSVARLPSEQPGL